MKKTAFAAVAALILTSCAQKPRLEVSFSDKFEGKEVQIMNFLDSTVIATARVENGHATLLPPDSATLFTAVLIDGRTRAFYITEPGTANVNDSTNSAVGTPLNNHFSDMLTVLDSIENLDDTNLYVDYVSKAYTETSGTPLALYFGVEWIRYASPETIDSLLSFAPQEISLSPKVANYKRMAELRSATEPGRQFIDFTGEDASGKPLSLSSALNKEGYTLVDFMASWCPYCIKELPDLAALNEKWKDSGLKIVSVAVRDTPEDTKAAVTRHNISWDVVYNTQRRPYDIYGITGIPHHILIGPDGKIVSRGETAAQIDSRLEAMRQIETAVSEN